MASPNFSEINSDTYLILIVENQFKRYVLNKVLPPLPIVTVEFPANNYSDTTKKFLRRLDEINFKNQLLILFEYKYNGAAWNLAAEFRQRGYTAKFNFFSDNFLDILIADGGDGVIRETLKIYGNSYD